MIYILQHVTVVNVHKAACTSSLSTIITIAAQIPYSGYFSGSKIFVSSEFLASSWKNLFGRGKLNYTPVLCVTVLWVKSSWFTSQP